jgi:hypothetical protein
MSQGVKANEGSSDAVVHSHTQQCRIPNGGGQHSSQLPDVCSTVRLAARNRCSIPQTRPHFGINALLHLPCLRRGGTVYGYALLRTPVSDAQAQSRTGSTGRTNGRGGPSQGLAARVPRQNRSGYGIERRLGPGIPPYPGRRNGLEPGASVGATRGFPSLASMCLLLRRDVGRDGCWQPCN